MYFGTNFVVDQTVATVTRDSQKQEKAFAKILPVSDLDVFELTMTFYMREKSWLAHIVVTKATTQMKYWTQLKNLHINCRQCNLEIQLKELL